MNDSDVSSDEDDNVLYVTAIDSPPKNRRSDIYCLAPIISLFSGFSLHLGSSAWL